MAHLSRRTLLGWGAAAAAAGLVPAGSTSASAGTRPNVVLVVADDLGPGDVGAYGGRLVRTPAMDRLAATGVTFDAMYAAASTDTPSRAGMLLGRYGARYRLPASLRPGATAGLPGDARTFAALLSAGGYATGLFGQWRLGSRQGQRPLDHGFDRFSGTLYGADVDPLAWWEDDAETEASFDPSTAARRITDGAIGFVEDERDRPFLAVLAHLTPHVPFAPEQRFAGRSRAGAYGDVVEEMDHHLGRLLRHLDRLRLTQRTLVVVTSDNGPRYEGRTQGRRGRKPEVFDGGVRVPFLASWQTVTRRERDRVPRSLLDLTPSLCTLAGVDVPGDLDGEDAAALLSGGEPPRRGPVYLFHDRWLNAVRDGRWKLHVAFRNDRREYMPQLYDVGADVRESYNLSAEWYGRPDPNHEVVDRLRTSLEAVRADVADEASSRSGE